MKNRQTVMRAARNLPRTTRGIITTYAAVAASISCLLGFVNALKAALNPIVKTRMRMIFKVPCPGTAYMTAEGPTRSPMVVSGRISCTSSSTRCLLRRYMYSSLLLPFSSGVAKTF